MKSRLLFLIANFIARFSTTMVSLLIVRLFGVDHAGIYAYILSIVTIVVAFSEFGMNQTFLVRSVDDSSAYIKRFLLVSRICISCLFLMLSTIIVCFYDSTYLIIIIAICFYMLLVNSISTYYISVKKFIASGLLRLVFALLILILAFIVGLGSGSFNQFLHIYPFVLLGMAFVFLGTKIKRSDLSFFSNIWQYFVLMLKDGVKYFMSGIILSLNVSLPVIALERVVASEQLGEFAVSLRIILIVYTVFSIISQLSFFDLLRSDSKEKQLLLQGGLFFSIAISSYVVICFLPESLFIKVFSVSDTSAAKIISILNRLKYVLLIQSINLPLGQYFAASSRVGYRLISQIIGLAISTALYFLCISSSSDIFFMPNIMILNETVVFLSLALILCLCSLNKKKRVRGENEYSIC